MTDWRLVTNRAGAEVWINLALATQMFRHEANKETLITFDQSNALVVKEAPDEIRQK